MYVFLFCRLCPDLYDPDKLAALKSLRSHEFTEKNEHIKEERGNANIKNKFLDRVKERTNKLWRLYARRRQMMLFKVRIIKPCYVLMLHHAVHSLFSGTHYIIYDPVEVQNSINILNKSRRLRVPRGEIFSTLKERRKASHSPAVDGLYQQRCARTQRYYCCQSRVIL